MYRLFESAGRVCVMCGGSKFHSSIVHGKNEYFNVLIRAWIPSKLLIVTVPQCSGQVLLYVQSSVQVKKVTPQKIEEL